MGLGIAAGGLALVLFLLAHLAAVSLAWFDPLRFERLSLWLHHWPGLPVLELLAAAAAVLHPLPALARSFLGRAARGAGAAPLRSRRGGGAEGLAALAARTAPWSGALLLVFLAVHLGQLRLRRPAPGQELAALEAALRQPVGLALYVAAGVAVGLHLFQGQEAAHRSLGLLDGGNGSRIRAAGRLVALLLGAGFALLPLALVLPPLAGPGGVG